MAGRQSVTAAGVVGKSGNPTYIYSLNIVSGNAGGIVKLYNGTSASGTYTQFDGVTNSGKQFDFGPEGMYFPGGCYADIDANVTSAIFDVKTVNTI